MNLCARSQNQHSVYSIRAFTAILLHSAQYNGDITYQFNGKFRQQLSRVKATITDSITTQKQHTNKRQTQCDKKQFFISDHITTYKSSTNSQTVNCHHWQTRQVSAVQVKTNFRAPSSSDSPPPSCPLS